MEINNNLDINNDQITQNNETLQINTSSIDQTTGNVDFVINNPGEEITNLPVDNLDSDLETTAFSNNAIETNPKDVRSILRTRGEDNTNFDNPLDSGLENLQESIMSVAKYMIIDRLARRFENTFLGDILGLIAEDYAAEASQALGIDPADLGARAEEIDPLANMLLSDRVIGDDDDSSSGSSSSRTGFNNSIGQSAFNEVDNAAGIKFSDEIRNEGESNSIGVPAGNEQDYSSVSDTNFSQDYSDIPTVGNANGLSGENVSKYSSGNGSGSKYSNDYSHLASYGQKSTAKSPLNGGAIATTDGGLKYLRGENNAESGTILSTGGRNKDGKMIYKNGDGEDFLVDDQGNVSRTVYDYKSGEITEQGLGNYNDPEYKGPVPAGDLQLDSKFRGSAPAPSTGNGSGGGQVGGS